MNVAFVMAYPGYLRYFDSVLQELVRRGHSVELYVESPKKQREGLEALRAIGPEVRYNGASPKRTDGWALLVDGFKRASAYAHYLDPAFSNASYLRERLERRLPVWARPLRRIRSLPRPLARTLVEALLTLEDAAPRSAEMDAWVRSLDADVLVVSPLVMPGSWQPDMIRSALALGVPTVAAVGSWDHLTTKGVARKTPTTMLVWNDAQAGEAVELHGFPRERLIVTGAQPFDRWFERQPSRSHEDFRREVGFQGQGLHLLFVGSTDSIAKTASEQEFVRRWIKGLRALPDPAVASLPVLIRPHPYNSEGWEHFDPTGLGDVRVWPRRPANPVDENDRADYFDSLYYSCAVVGVNTSAMIEAAVVGRPVLTIEYPSFRHSQAGTLHFRHLRHDAGGCALVADSLEAHFEQLQHVLRDPTASVDRQVQFLERFVRPNGLETPATPLVAAAIERTATMTIPARDPAGLLSRALRPLLYPVVLSRLALSRGPARRLRRHVGSLLRRRASA